MVKETSTLKGGKSDLGTFPYKLDPPADILISGNGIPFFQLFEPSNFKSSLTSLS